MSSWPPSPDPETEDSPRLQKAKILLGQFTAEEEEDLGGAMAISSSTAAGGVSGTSTKPLKATKTRRTGGHSTAASKISIDPVMTPNGGKNSSPSTITITPSGEVGMVVPDNYWSNGLLDGSDVVTRYAFRRGVKIAEPLVKYDPEAAEQLLFRQPTKWFVRNIQIAGPLGWWAVGVALDYLQGSSGTSSQRERRAVQLRDAISGLGPAIIKAGQALASRPDLLPSEYLEELQKLQDDVPRFSNELAFATVEQELGVDFDDVFDLVQEEPVAAASIGQG
jgi:hypothetical protein